MLRVFRRSWRGSHDTARSGGRSRCILPLLGARSCAAGGFLRRVPGHFAPSAGRGFPSLPARRRFRPRFCFLRAAFPGDGVTTWVPLRHRPVPDARGYGSCRAGILCRPQGLSLFFGIIRFNLVVCKVPLMAVFSPRRSPCWAQLVENANIMRLLGAARAEASRRGGSLPLTPQAPPRNYKIKAGSFIGECARGFCVLTGGRPRGLGARLRRETVPYFTSFWRAGDTDFRRACAGQIKTGLSHFRLLQFQYFAAPAAAKAARTAFSPLAIASPLAPARIAIPPVRQLRKKIQPTRATARPPLRVVLL